MSQKTLSSHPRLLTAVLYLASFVVLVDLTVVSVPFLVNMDFIKEVLQQKIHRWDSAQLDFETARLQLVPRFGIKIRNLTLSHPQQANNASPSLEAHHAFITLDLLSFLKGHLVGDIVVTQPRMFLKREEKKLPEQVNLHAEEKSPEGLRVNALFIEEGNLEIELPSYLPKPRKIELKNLNIKFAKEEDNLKVTAHFESQAVFAVVTRGSFDFAGRLTGPPFGLDGNFKMKILEGEGDVESAPLQQQQFSYRWPDHLIMLEQMGIKLNYFLTGQKISLKESFL